MMQTQMRALLRTISVLAALAWAGCAGDENPAHFDGGPADGRAADAQSDSGQRAAGPATDLGALVPRAHEPPDD